MDNIYHFRAIILKKQSPLMKKIVNEFDDYVPKVIDQSLARMTCIKSQVMKDRIKKVRFSYNNK